MSDSTFHRRHAVLLRFLTEAGAVDGLLRRVADRNGWSTELGWTRVWGRLVDPTDGGARLLYQVEGPHARLCTLSFGSSASAAEATIHSDVGPVGVTVFPDDCRLPTLAAVMARNTGALVVRYRPGKRCTLRTAAGGRYLKVFPDDRGARLYTEGTQLWQAAERGAIGFAVARPTGFERSLRTYEQDTVTGAPIIDRLFGPEAASLAHRLGAASATMTSSGLRPTNRHDTMIELRRSRRRAAEVVAFAPGLGQPMAAFLATIERRHHQLDPAPLRPIHGSPHPNQWLADGSALGLVDFDRLSLGDPELDVATFATEVDYEAASNRHEINQSFEQGYRQQHGGLDLERLELYRAHKRLAKVHRTVCAIRPDGDRRAAEHLRAAGDALRSGASNDLLNGGAVTGRASDDTGGGRSHEEVLGR